MTAINYKKFGINTLSHIDQIAFFWIGHDITIPSFLVKSIKLVYSDDIRIYHLTNFQTPKIEGVTKTVRNKLPNDIMLARLHSYRNFPYNGNMTFFCDADSLVTRKLELHTLKHDIYLIKRKEDFVINHNFPEYYPEFVNKKIMDIMPYLFGGMSFRNGEEFFSILLEKCYSLPERFHRWYGDQYALTLLLRESKIAVNFLPINMYLKIVREVMQVMHYEYLIDNNTKLITFKGPHTKRFIKESYENLLRFYQK